jgi:acetyl-CoA carboxylase biotin carboxyl carrier protein
VSQRGLGERAARDKLTRHKKRLGETPLDLTNDDVDEIVKILDASFAGELTLKTARFEIALRREGGGWTQERRTLGAPSSVEAVSATIIKAPVADGLLTIVAPMIGTFYRAPKPGAPPFVEIGASVTPDTVIGIIETMKLMNAAPAGVRGEIVEICVENGALVEAGQVLMRVKPAP